MARPRAAAAATRPHRTPTAVRSTLPKTTAPSSPSTASTVRWVDAATHTTTPTPRASWRHSRSRRSGLPDGVRDFRRRRASPLGARIQESCQVWRGTRPAGGQL